MKEKTQNAINALLDEYKKAIFELQELIKNISDQELTKIIDLQTANPECRSIQTVLTHVISSGYSYCVYIQNFRGINSTRPDKVFRTTALEFIEDLNKVIQFTYQTFAEIYDYELEEFENDKKIKTQWKQIYDIEQMMEHAIVHVLRHRRQVEKFKSLL